MATSELVATSSRSAIEQIGVHIKGHAGLGVAQHPLHRSDIRPGADGETRGGVA
jgi:hypothetical protein